MKRLLPSGDLLKWVAAGCALVATASAEYEIARAIGMHPWVAAAVPGALDAYVLRALRAHREVLAAVLAMVGVNAASHLLSAGLLPLDWRLVTAVSAIAPLVLWRVHALGTRTPAEHADTVSVPDVPPLPVRVPGESLPSTVTCSWCGWNACPEDRLALHQRTSCPKRWEHLPSTGPGEHAVCFCGAEVWGDLEAHQRAPGHVGTFDEHADTAVTLASTPDHEPFPYQWDDASTPDHEPFPYQWDDASTASTPVLRLVPDPVLIVPDFTERAPVTFTGARSDQEHVSAGVLHPSDTVFLERARVLAGQVGRVPGVNDFKRELNVGTPRAQRLVAALTIEHTRAQEGSTS